MITINIYHDHDRSYRGFSTGGHAEFAEEGYDIICAAVSVLTINTINSIDQFTDVRYTVDSDQEEGRIDFRLTDHGDTQTDLLMKSMILGLQGIQEDYGDDYLILNFKEV